MIRVILWNRFSLVFGVIVVGTVLWNLWVIAHDDGIIAGQVLDSRNAPLSGVVVTVVANEINNLSATPIEITTNEEGRFEYSGVTFFNFNIVAKKPGFKDSPTYNYHLYFRSQNYTLPQPMILGAAE